MFWFIYHLPLHVVIIAIIVSVFGWGAIMTWLKNKSEKSVRIINIILAVVSFCGIIGMAVYRHSKGVYENCFIPFYSFVKAKEQKEMYRTMLMNVFLFVPFGITVPFAITRKKHSAKKKDIVLTTILIAALVSVSIEAHQYFFSMGRCEIDDMLCNTFGAILGTFTFWLY